MFFSKKQLLAFIAITHILFPLVLITSLFYLGTQTLTIVIPSILLIGMILFTLFKIGAWEFTNYYIRYIILLIFLILSSYCLLQVKVITNYLDREYICMTILGIVIVGFIIYNIKIALAIKKPKHFIKLLFPLKRGRYLITDGGDGKKCAGINYHYKANIHTEKSTNTSMQFAVDIVFIDKKGRTVSSLLTDDNRDYKIFHEPVYSPCGGKIVEVVSDINNNKPFSKKYPYNVGNHIVIKKGEYYIVIGHLEKNSIKVKVGEKVQIGQFLGSVGNSGLTPRPHIHMQVSKASDEFYWQGEGVPIIFNGYFYPVKNKIIKIT